MEIFSKTNYSPIIEAIQEAEERTTRKIRVYITKRFIEKNPLARASKIFNQYAMSGSILVYINLRRKKLAVVADQEIHQALGHRYWTEVVFELAEELRSTYSERAIATVVKSIGLKLKEKFPS